MYLVNFHDMTVSPQQGFLIMTEAQTSDFLKSIVQADEFLKQGFVFNCGNHTFTSDKLMRNCITIYANFHAESAISLFPILTYHDWGYSYGDIIYPDTIKDFVEFCALQV